MTDQGVLSIDTADATAAAFQFALAKAKGTRASSFTPSHLFIYYNARRMEGNTAKDTGCTIRSALQSIVQHGVCSEQDWPLEEVNPSTMGMSGRFPEDSKPAQEPPASVYENARSVIADKDVSYARLDNDLGHLKQCLAEGYPFIFGFHVYKAFRSDDEDGISSSGVLDLPRPTEAWSQHDHAVLAVGYDDASQRFIVRNSWGEGWGQKGYFTMPYAYFEEMDSGVTPAVPYARNAWTLRITQ
jgi:C1A family cysteine protease